MQNLWTSSIRTPFGMFCIKGNHAKIYSTGFYDGTREPYPTENIPPLLREATRQLTAYFAGTLATFSVSMAISGTDFQCRVWQQTLQIPFGETISYKELAFRIGHPQAARAVGRALHYNPLPILVPCHRVISTNGSLTGFAYGIDMKKSLLEHEQQRKLS